MIETQGDTPRKKEEVGRLQRRVRTFKGNLTVAITSFISSIEYYEKKYPRDDEVEPISTKIDYAQDILKAQERAMDRYVKLENALDELKNLLSDTWDGSEDELETALSKHTKEFLPASAGLYVTMSVCLSVGRSVGRSVGHKRVLTL